MADPMPDLAPFLHLRRHVTVAHHVAGRIRLKLAPAALRDMPSADPAPFLDLLRRLPVRIARLNPAALSVVVEYDPQVIGAADWQVILNGGAAEIAATLNRQLGDGASPHQSQRSIP
ncbi:hypothetical protein [Paracoccus sp. pheM1]|uniref:hypothetical protein n=1 Tax=Paracoccus sp. pheM1 TaxID=2831675 RepID=UPI001BDB7B9B|nr:hypothetical protein [Paracoccus sp. pheM1]MBT0778771.1 hypothetical protein [Paracoccus sp. pheM1]